MSSYELNVHCLVYVRFSVSLIFGFAIDGVDGIPSSSMADTGGLVANGEGTAAGNPNAAPEEPRLNPKVGNPEGGGLVAEPEGMGVPGPVPLLNSAQRGHFRFVSASLLFTRRRKKKDGGIRTHVSHLSTVTAPPLQYNALVICLMAVGRKRTVVSGFNGRLSCIGVPPSLTIFAFFRWRRLS